MVNLLIEPLQKTLHNRKDFDCGESAVNNFLYQSARKQMDLRINYTWVAVRRDTTYPADILAFFTLTHGIVLRSDLPPESSRNRWPRFPLPVVKLAWLGVHNTVQGGSLRLGELMLVEAINRAQAMSTEAGIGIALVTEPLSVKSERFFLKYGFMKMQRPFRQQSTLFLPL